MRAFLAVVAVVATVLLGVIAVELYPIARIAYGVTHLGDDQPLTDAQRRERTKRFMDDADAEWKAFTDVMDQKHSRSKQQTPPRSTAPARP